MYTSSMEVAMYTGDARLLAARLDELQAAQTTGLISGIPQKLLQVQHAVDKCKVGLLREVLTRLRTEF